MEIQSQWVDGIQAETAAVRIIWKMSSAATITRPVRQSPDGTAKNHAENKGVTILRGHELIYGAPQAIDDFFADWSVQGDHRWTKEQLDHALKTHGLPASNGPERWLD